eukprot:scaffold68282_cov28-Tisochrysis_lutea.AAC.2
MCRSTAKCADAKADSGGDVMTMSTCVPRGDWILDGRAELPASLAASLRLGAFHPLIPSL